MTIHLRRTEEAAPLNPAQREGMSRLMPMLLYGLISFGCATTYGRREYIGSGQTTVVLRRSIDDCTQVLANSFLKRGYQMVDKRPGPSGEMLLKFKGGNVPLTTVSGNRHWVGGSTDVVGSVFVAELTSVDSITTKMYVFGKPTYNGVEACSQDQATAPCLQYLTLGDYERFLAQEEADTVHSVMFEFPPAEIVADAGIGAHKTIWKCFPSQDPRWKTADPYEKKKLLEACLER